MSKSMGVDSFGRICHVRIPQTHGGRVEAQDGKRGDAGIIQAKMGALALPANAAAASGLAFCLGFFTLIFTFRTVL